MVWSGKLLVFEHPNSPEVGIQVPAGTIEPGEDPTRAALREASEESGLAGAIPEAIPVFGIPYPFTLTSDDVDPIPVSLFLEQKLGVRDLDVRPYGLNQIHRRHFFGLRMEGDLPDSWTAFEEHPSVGDPRSIEFRMFWVDLPDGIPTIYAGLGDLLDELIFEGGS